MKPILTAFLLMLFAVHFISCDNPSSTPPSNEQELITHVTLTLVDSANTSDTVLATFNDPDGDGGAAPIITGVTLSNGKTYFGSISLVDSSKIPAVDIGAEVLEKATQHQFFFTPKGDLSSRMKVVATDKDSKNLPLGLQFKISILQGAGAATGALNVVLSHYDNVVKDGSTRSNESDIDIDFPVTISQ